MFLASYARTRLKYLSICKNRFMTEKKKNSDKNRRKIRKLSSSSVAEKQTFTQKVTVE